jgi:hypothetical protein
MLKTHYDYPLAITMWDFSWLERRWPGAGYEDWNQALDELKERGYDAVRIDAYPHLISADPEKEWELLPVWNQQDWGSPALNRVQVQPYLNQFIQKCRERNLKVGLSTWFREDQANTRLQIKNPHDLGKIWKETLDSIAQADLLDSILYVDLCNEFPLAVWAAFLPETDPGVTEKEPISRVSSEGVAWMADSIAVVRESYPELDYCFSFCSEYDTWKEQDVSALDLLELHLWVPQFSDFNQQVGYNFERFSSTGYENLVQKGEKLYRENPDYWKNCLRQGIESMAAWSKFAGKPIITTECWSIVDYKDWPLLNWGWIKDLCEFGVTTASATGRWVAIGTSNFCGPQFKGMWRDVAWHQRLTSLIHAGKLPK